MFALRGYVPLFDCGHVPKLDRAGWAFVSQVAGSTSMNVLRATKRSSEVILRSTARNGILGRLKSKVLPKVALAMRLDLVFHQINAL